MARRMRMRGSTITLDPGQERILEGSPSHMLRFIITAIREFASAQGLPEEFERNIRGTVTENASGGATIDIWNKWERRDETGTVSLGAVYEKGAVAHEILPRRGKAMKWSEFTGTVAETRGLMGLHASDADLKGATPGMEYSVFSKRVWHPGTPAYGAMKRGYRAGIRRYKRWVESGLSYSDFVRLSESRRRPATAIRRAGAPVLRPSPRFSRDIRDAFVERHAMLAARARDIEEERRRIMREYTKANRLLDRRLGKLAARLTMVVGGEFEGASRENVHYRLREDYKKLRQWPRRRRGMLARNPILREYASIKDRIEKNKDIMDHWQVELAAAGHHAQAEVSRFIGTWNLAARGGNYARARADALRADPYGPWHRSRQAAAAAREAARRAMWAARSAKGMRTRVRRAERREDRNRGPAMGAPAQARASVRYATNLGAKGAELGRALEAMTPSQRAAMQRADAAWNAQFPGYSPAFPDRPHRRPKNRPPVAGIDTTNRALFPLGEAEQRRGKRFDEALRGIKEVVGTGREHDYVVPGEVGFEENAAHSFAVPKGFRKYMGEAVGGMELQRAVDPRTRRVTERGRPEIRFPRGTVYAMEMRHRLEAWADRPGRTDEQIRRAATKMIEHMGRMREARSGSARAAWARKRVNEIRELSRARAEAAKRARTRLVK